MSVKLNELLAEAQNDLEAALELDNVELATECQKQVDVLQTKIAASAGTTPVQLEITADNLGLKPVVETSIAEGENAMPNTLTITKESLGITGFESVLASLSLATIDKMVYKVSDTEDLVALVLPGWTSVDPSKRIHIGDERGDVKRAARGAALAAAGAIQEEGDILSNSGRIYTIRDGRCFRLEQQPQVNFDGSQTMLVKEVPCTGHLKYKKSADGFVVLRNPDGSPQEHMRCAHGWAQMYGAGYFATFSEKTYAEIAKVEIAQRVGDDAARAFAREKIAGWVSNNTQRQSARVAVAQAIDHAKNTGAVTAEGFLPPNTNALALPFEAGTLADAIRSLNGQRFIVRYSMPLKSGNAVESNIRASNLQELAHRIAPSMAAAKMAGGELSIVSVTPY